jgi:hypothetical protein
LLLQTHLQYLSAFQFLMLPPYFEWLLTWRLLAFLLEGLAEANLKAFETS